MRLYFGRLLVKRREKIPSDFRESLQTVDPDTFADMASEARVGMVRYADPGVYRAEFDECRTSGDVEIKR